MKEENGNLEIITPRQTLPKSCRLRHRTLVEGLFADGNKAYEFPVRAMWRVLTDEELSGLFRIAVPSGIGRVQMMVTIPKRKRRHAVDRVLLRRRVREAYRRHRYILEEAMEARPDLRTLSLSLIYLHDDNTDYATIERKIVKILRKISTAIAPKPSSDPN